MTCTLEEAGEEMKTTHKKSRIDVFKKKQQQLSNFSQVPTDDT